MSGYERKWAYWLLREVGIQTRPPGRPGPLKSDAPAIYKDLARKRWLCA